MPIYEYVCNDCGTEFDHLRSMKDADTPIACDHCQGMHTHRMISVFYAQSNGHSVSSAASKSGCGGCGGGSCGSCGHH